MTEASIEPRSFERGNMSDTEKARRYRRASIEPRSFERGNPSRAALPDMRDICFN